MIAGSRLAIAIASISLAVGSLAVGSGTAAAQPSPNSAAAAAQFDKGRAAMKEKKYEQACTAFERSQKLEPAPGTLFNLAICYTHVGKLATAWAAFRDLSARDTNKQRKKAAAEQAASLEKRLPKLVIAIDTPPSGLVVKLDGTDVTNLVGIDSPVDLGTHTLEATAPGHARFTTSAKIKEEGKTVTVDVVLRPEGTPIAGGGNDDGGGDDRPPPVAGGDDRPPPATERPGPRSTRKRTAVLVGITGGLFVGAGAIFGSTASSKWAEAKELCGEDLTCSNASQLEEGNALVDDARLNANVSTGFFIGGAALIGVATYLFVTAPAKPSKHALRLSPTTSGTNLGVSLEGRF